MFDDSPKTSIILPCYNREHLISSAIESCLSQTYENIELIIIDDASSDNSVKVIESYQAKDSRIKFIKNKSNKGLPATLNIGFAAASGDYLTWSSDDNLFKPDAIEIMVNHLKQNPQIGLVYTDYTTIDGNGKKIARIYQESPEYLPIRDCVGACFLYTRKAMEKTGKYNEEMPYVEDYEFFLRMGLVTKIAHIPKSFYLYRVHTGALTQLKKKEIKLAKLKLKAAFANKYQIPRHLEPINDLYMWYIKDKNFGSYIALAKIFLKSPIAISSYIIKNFVRLLK